MKAVKELVLGQRRLNDPSLVEIHTADGKGLVIFDNNAVALCYFSENEGFTLTGIEAFKKMAAIISKSGHAKPTAPGSVLTPRRTRPPGCRS